MITSLLLAVALAADPAPKKPDTPPTIGVVPFSGQAMASGTALRINGHEFELLKLDNYAGAVTWDVTTPGGEALPVKWFQCKPKSIVIGVRAGQAAPAEYETPDSPAVVVYASSSGRAVVAAWGVAEGRPVKLATMLIDANRGPQPPPPGPGPTPDNDPLWPALSGIYGGDQFAGKREAVLKLAAVYEQAGGITDRASSLTELLSQLSAIGRASVPAGTLSALRDRIADELGSQLGTADAQLTPELRAKCKGQFTRMAGLLRRLGQ